MSVVLRPLCNIRLLSVLIFLCAGSLCAASFTATQSGNWNDVATWGGGGFPGAADSATFNLQSDSGNWFRFNAPAIINAVGANFNRSAGTGQFNFEVDFTNNGTMTLNSGTLNMQGSFTNTNAVNVTAGSLSLGNGAS